MYEALTVFIPELEKGDYGDWTEQTGDGTPENPYEFCHIEYSKPVTDLKNAFFRFRKNHPEMDLTGPSQILDENGIRLEDILAGRSDFSSADGRTVLAVFLLLISLTRFNDTLFLDSCKSGSILNLLKRLKELDETGGRKDIIKHKAAAHGYIVS